MKIAWSQIPIFYSGFFSIFQKLLILFQHVCLIHFFSQQTTIVRPKICLPHTILNCFFFKSINTSGFERCSLNSKKIPRFPFWNAPSGLSDFNTRLKIEKVHGDFLLPKRWRYPYDNVENCAMYSKWLPNEEKV